MRNWCSLISIRDCCPSKLRWAAVLAKHGGTAFSPGLVKTVVSQISSLDCGLDSKHLIVKYEELLFTHKHTGQLSQQIAKDCGPCLMPLVCKETAVLVFPLLSQQIKKDCGPSKAWGTAYPPPPPSRACENGCFTI